MGNSKLPPRGSNPTILVQHWDHSETRRAAESAFDAYVQQSAALSHYISVTDRKGPIRRIDQGQDAFRLAATKSQFVWNATWGRWYRKNGVLPVLEEELWRVILFYLRKGNTDNATSLYDMLSREIEGVERQDVIQVWQIWRKCLLNRTDFTRGVRWELSGQEESTSLRLPSTRATPHSPDSSLPSLKSYLDTTGEPTRDHVDFNPEFHHEYPRLLKIGTRDTDGTAVWITFLKGEKKASRCFDENLQLTSIHKLGTVWLPELQLDLFDGACKRDKETCRRDYLSALIEKHLSRETSSVRDCSKVLDLIPGLRSRSRKAANEDHSDTEDLSNTDNTSTLSESTEQRPTRRTRPMTRGSVEQVTETVTGRLRSKKASKRTGQEPNSDVTNITEARSFKRRKQQIPQPTQATRTVLRVSISSKPTRAPMNVLFADCGDVDTFFHKVLTEGGIKESSSMSISEISATITHSGRGHLIRRDNAEDWEFFHRDLKRAWKMEADLFIDADCEVDILVHTNI